MGKFSIIAFGAMMILISTPIEIQGEDLETAWEKYQVCLSLLNNLSNFFYYLKWGCKRAIHFQLLFHFDTFIL